MTAAASIGPIGAASLAGAGTGTIVSFGLARLFHVSA